VDLIAFVWDDSLARAVLGVLLANFLVRMAAALSRRTFRLRVMADWHSTRALPYLLRAAVVEIALLTLPPEWGEVKATARSAVWLFVCSALARNIVEALREV
jgi:hypothetical protein